MTDLGDKPLEKLYVIGGRQRAARSLRAGQGAWQGYDRGLVLAVDVNRGNGLDLLRVRLAA